MSDIETMDASAFGDDVETATNETPILTDDVAEQFGEDVGDDNDTTEVSAKEPDDDDLDDDMIDKESDGDDPEFEIDADTKLKRSEIKDMIEAKATYSKYNDELAIVGREREALQAQSKVIFEDFVPKLRNEYNVALQVAMAQIPAAPDHSLMANDPSTYLMMKEYRDQAIANVNKIKSDGEQALARAKSEQDAAQIQLTQQRQVAEMDKLMKAVPALKSETKANAYLKSLTEFGKQYGYSETEINETILSDHRAALILRKAALYDRSRSEKKPIQNENKAVSTPRSIPAPKRSANSPQMADRRTLAKTLQNPNASRSDMMDRASAYFSD
jgi:hypothetical protein